MQTDPELRQVSRLHRELVEAAKLVKLFQRVEDAKSASELQSRFQALVVLETEALADRQTQKQLTIDLQKLTDQRTKLMQLSSSLQEMNKALQSKLDLVQKEHSQLEAEVAALKKDWEAAVKGKTEAESLCAQLKKTVETTNGQVERERTQWAREQQLHRTQEQKLIALVQQAERAQVMSQTQSSEVAEELTTLKSRLADALSALQQIDALKSALVLLTQSSRETQIASLERKCLRYERELKLKEDEQDL